MDTQAANSLFTPEDRQRLADEFAAEQGADWLENNKPGSFGCHELLDRTNIVGDLVEQQVLHHPACVANPEWFALADQAVAALRELYQRIGAEHV